jgi:hypothetical protein
MYAERKYSHIADRENCLQKEMKAESEADVDK